MPDRLTSHDMEMLCRQRAVLDIANSAKWLAEAERWRKVAHDDAAKIFHGQIAGGEKRPWPSPPEDEQK